MAKSMENPQHIFPVSHRMRVSITINRTVVGLCSESVLGGIYTLMWDLRYPHWMLKVNSRTGKAAAMMSLTKRVYKTTASL